MHEKASRAVRCPNRATRHNNAIIPIGWGSGPHFGSVTDNSVEWRKIAQRRIRHRIRKETIDAQNALHGRRLEGLPPSNHRRTGQTRPSRGSANVCSTSNTLPQASVPRHLLSGWAGQPDRSARPWVMAQSEAELPVRFIQTARCTVPALTLPASRGSLPATPLASQSRLRLK
jgi:hypothetical protein